MDAFPIKQQDTAPSMRMVLSDDDGVIDLTGADSVELNFKDAPARRCSGATVSLVETRRACAVEVAASGQIRFDWIPADTATARSMSLNLIQVMGVNALLTLVAWGFDPKIPIGG